MFEVYGSTNFYLAIVSIVEFETVTVALWYRLPLGTEQVHEFDSWQCRIYIPCSLSLRLLGSLRVLWVHMAWHKNCVKNHSTQSNTSWSFFVWNNDYCAYVSKGEAIYFQWSTCPQPTLSLLEVGLYTRSGDSCLSESFSSYSLTLSETSSGSLAHILRYTMSS